MSSTNIGSYIKTPSSVWAIKKALKKSDFDTPDKSHLYVRLTVCEETFLVTKNWF